MAHLPIMKKFCQPVHRQPRYKCELIYDFPNVSDVFHGGLYNFIALTGDQEKENQFYVEILTQPYNKYCNYSRLERIEVKGDNCMLILLLCFKVIVKILLSFQLLLHQFQKWISDGVFYEFSEVIENQSSFKLVK